jgi:hypothetical protein
MSRRSHWKVHPPKRRTFREMGKPTQKIWITTPISIIFAEKGYFVALLLLGAKY